jgi:hypothetical protein
LPIFFLFGQKSIAHLWGCYGVARNLPLRPGFDGYYERLPDTGKVVLDFPEPLRRSRVRFGLCVSASVAAIMLGAVVGNFATKAALMKATQGTERALAFVVPALMSAVQITLFGYFYEILADHLTEYENHRTSLTHNSALFKKLFVFYALNYFSGEVFGSLFLFC